MIAERLKKILPKVISPSQKGYLKGRFIGENTRFLYDLMKITEEKSIPGLLLLIDFEKAFDTVEWSFIDNCLKYFNFGISLRSWIKTFYSGISSSVCSNGHIPEFFKISRGVRQGDPLSPYLFLIVGEVLYRAANRNKKIIGINIDSYTFLMNQLADDTCMFLDGTEESLKACLDLYNDFSKCSGLRINLSKTKAIWIGSKTKSLEILLAGEQLTWLLQGEEFSYLGQFFSTSLDKILTSNYDPVISAIDKLLAGWGKNRILTIMGKIQVTKSLAIPKLVHLLMSLPSPTPDMMNRLNKIFYTFIWDGNPDKISRKVLIEDYSAGGLKMTNIEVFDKALKATWINRMFHGKKEEGWIALFCLGKAISIDRFKYMCRSNKKTLVAFSKSVNNLFWKEVICSWGGYLGDPVAFEEILIQPLWENHLIGNKKNKVWLQRGIQFLSDIVDENGDILAFENFKQKFRLEEHTNFLDYFSLIKSLPSKWKEIIKSQTQSKNTDPLITKLCRAEKAQRPSQVIYQELRKSVAKRPQKCLQKWEASHNIDMDSWPEIFKLAHDTVTESKLKIFQYKLLLRILPTNRLLRLMKIRQSDLCSFCDKETESISHLFWECESVLRFWNSLSLLVSESNILRIDFNQRNILFGISKGLLSVNYLILVGKYYIYKCKWLGIIPKTKGFIQYLKFRHDIEKCMALLGTNKQYKNTWTTLKSLIS